jgi:hypothetical protein
MVRADSPDAQTPDIRPNLRTTGIAASIAPLYLNLDTFPSGPADAGSVDVGPVLAIWFPVVNIRVV